MSTWPAIWGNQAGVIVGGHGTTATIDELTTWAIPIDGDFTPPNSPYLGTEIGLVGLWHFDGNLAGIRGPAGL